MNVDPDPRGFARFDACDGEGRSFEFQQLLEIVVARELREVVPALMAVEAAVAKGAHAAGYIGYEAAPAFDPALVCHPPPPDLPLVWFGIFGTLRDVDPPGPEAEPRFELAPWEPAVEWPAYARRVAAIREWIAAGDSYQVNLTFPLRARFTGDDFALYRQLCRSQRSGYCALLRLPEHSVVSASPELFFRWRRRELALRPMKGTRPRGRWPAEDQALAAELLASEKERAENLMIVDLLRNDAGRVAEFGSVHVPRLFRVESYPTVHQLTSTVRARTRADVSLVELLAALFPCGSVTGAPKIRTMQLIAELEEEPRGVYTGAIGFVSPGEAVFSVAIRTLLLHRRRQVAELAVGSGITYDSEAEAEYRECLQKAAFTHARLPEFELLETFAYLPGEGFLLLPEHLSRLKASARYFGFRIDIEAVRRELREEPCSADEPARVRLLVARSGAVRLEWHPLPPAPPLLRARLALGPVDSGDPFLYHKTTRREAYERRLAEVSDADEVLLWNERGELTEFTTGNLVVRREGEDWTPPVASGLLAGTLREVLLRRGELRERLLRPSDLIDAEAVFHLNSVRGRTRVEMIGTESPPWD